MNINVNGNVVVLGISALVILLLSFVAETLGYAVNRYGLLNLLAEQLGMTIVVYWLVSWIFDSVVKEPRFFSFASKVIGHLWSASLSTALVVIVASWLAVTAEIKLSLVLASSVVAVTTMHYLGTRNPLPQKVG